MNKLQVGLDEVGRIHLSRAGYCNGIYTLETTEALRAFFQAERDEALGRWRDPENPNVVVYPCLNQDDGYGRVVWVLDEAEMVSGTVLDDRHSHSSASRYFAAHPQPEPRPPFAAYVDKNGSAVWVTDENGNLRCLSDQNLDPEKYAPFTRLLPDE